MTRRLLLYVVAVVMASATALPACAYRRAYRVTLNGTVQAGSEVCFYRGTSPDDPFQLFFGYKRVACMPADQVLDFPSGLYHAFARNTVTGHVSAHRDYFIYPEPARPEQGYEELEIPLTRAGVVDFTEVRETLMPGQSVGVWIAPSTPSGPTFFPLVDGEERLLVPADTPFVPLVVENGLPVAVGDREVLRPNSTRKIAPFAPSPGSAALVAWVAVDATSVQPPGQAGGPEITLTAGEQTLAPLLPLTDETGSVAKNSFLFFRNVPRGSARLRVKGALWAESDREVAVNHSVNIEFDPLVLSARGALLVTWDVDTPAPPADGCSTKARPRPAITAWLSRCDSATSANQKCETVARASTAFGFGGSLQLRGLHAGTYVLHVQPPFSEAIEVPAIVHVGVETRHPVPLDLFRFHGRLTVNGKPAEGRLLFESGEAYSDTTGTYRAALASDPLTNLIRILLCADGRTVTHIPTKPIRRNSVYDVNLEFAPLTVRATDERDEPVAGAKVRYLPVKEVTANGPIFFYSSAPATTAADGRVVFEDAPSEYRVQVCGEHPDFADTCTEPLRVADIVNGPLRLNFSRAALRGKVQGHRGRGMIAFVAGTRITEEVPVTADGSFALKSMHRHPEHAVYVSDAAPLAVFALPPASEAPDLVFTHPGAPVRSFTASLRGETSLPGFVGLWVGEQYVPLSILAFHQDARGGDVVVSNGRPLLIRDIAGAGPIHVAFAASDRDAAGFVDPFTLPQYAGVKRVVVSGDAVQLEP